MSIALGFFLEVLLLGLALFSDTLGDTPKPFLSDLVQKISWSFIVSPAPPPIPPPSWI